MLTTATRNDTEFQLSLRGNSPLYRRCPAQISLRLAGPGPNIGSEAPEGRGIGDVASLSLVGFAFYMVVLIGAFAVRSAAGFGAVLIAIPLLAFILPVSTAVAVTTVLTAITSIHQVGREWRRVAWWQFSVMTFYST